MPISGRSVTFGSNREIPPPDLQQGTGKSPYRPRAESAHSIRGNGLYDYYDSILAHVLINHHKTNHIVIMSNISGRPMGGGLTRGQHTSSKASDLDDITADLLRYVPILYLFSYGNILFSPLPKCLK